MLHSTSLTLVGNVVCKFECLVITLRSKFLSFIMKVKLLSGEVKRPESICFLVFMELYFIKAVVEHLENELS